MDRGLLGGLTRREFLRRHWQKRPLFVRGALPGFEGVLEERALGALAARSDVAVLARRCGGDAPRLQREACRRMTLR